MSAKKGERIQKPIRMTPEQFAEFDSVLMARRLAGKGVTQQDAFVEAVDLWIQENRAKYGNAVAVKPGSARRGVGKF